MMIFSAGKEYGVDPRLIHAVAYQESRYKINAESPVGAKGLMQMMPATAARFAVEGKTGVEQNVYAGTKLLRWLLKRFDGNVALALAGYNAGEGSVDKYDGIPPYKETENYVRKITANYGKTYHPVLDPADANIYFHLTEEIAQQ
jgi:soluble lytic murein transglycosylase-like protein